tara:strand:+ start:859 stop:1074 length:216 start_codon:yes stop_codon:yes gene_type:complete
MGAQLRLQEVLARMQNKPAPPPAPIVYAPQEIDAASSILQRLLAHAAAATTATTSTVSRTSHPAIENSDDS